MHQLTCLESELVSGGGFSNAILASSFNDLIKWGAAAGGAAAAYCLGQSHFAYAFTVFGAPVSPAGVVCGAAGLAVGYAIGKLYNEQILERLD